MDKVQTNTKKIVVEKKFSEPVQADPEAHPASSTVDTG
jgi:hypothetical protein